MIPHIINGKWRVFNMLTQSYVAGLLDHAALTFDTLAEAHEWVVSYRQGKLRPGPGMRLGDPWVNYETLSSILAREAPVVETVAAAGRPCSMYGGLKYHGTARATTAADGPRLDNIPVSALVLAFRAGMDGLGFDSNEEALTAGVPVLAFQ